MIVTVKQGLLRLEGHSKSAPFVPRFQEVNGRYQEALPSAGASTTLPQTPMETANRLLYQEQASRKQDQSPQIRVEYPSLHHIIIKGYTASPPSP